MRERFPDDLIEFPDRQEIETIPADPPGKITLGWVVQEKLGKGYVNPRIFQIEVPKLSEEKWTQIIYQWYIRDLIGYYEMCVYLEKETPTKIGCWYHDQRKMIKIMNDVISGK